MSNSHQTLELALSSDVIEQWLGHNPQTVERLFPGAVTCGSFLRYQKYCLYLDNVGRGRNGDWIFIPDCARPAEWYLAYGTQCPGGAAYRRDEDLCTRGHGVIELYAHIHGIAREDAIARIAKELGLPGSLEGLLQASIIGGEHFVNTVDTLDLLNLPKHPVLDGFGLMGSLNLLAYRSADNRYHCAAILFEHYGKKYTLPASAWVDHQGNHALQWLYPPVACLFNLNILQKYPSAKVLLVPDEHAYLEIMQECSGLVKGFIVSTWLCGFSRAIKKVDWSPLIGREVVILVEYTEAGYRKAKRLYEALDKSGVRHIHFLSNASLRVQQEKKISYAANQALVKVLVNGCLESRLSGFNEFVAEANSYFNVGFKSHCEFKALPLSEFMGLSSADEKWVIPGLIRLKDRILVYAAKGVGKTWLVTMLYLCAAGGRSFPNMQLETGKGVRVLVVDGEDSKVELTSRINALSAGIGLPLDVLGDKIRIVSAAVSGDIIHIGTEGVQSSLAGDISWADVIVLDNLNALWPESLQSSPETSAALNTLINQWALQGKAVIVVNHASRNGKSFGSSTKEFGVETQITLTRNAKREYTSFKVSFYTRWCGEIQPMTFTLVPDGEAIHVEVEQGGYDSLPAPEADVSGSTSYRDIEVSDNLTHIAEPCVVDNALTPKEQLVFDWRSKGLSCREIEDKTAEMARAGIGRKISKSAVGDILKRCRKKGFIPPDDASVND